MGVMLISKRNGFGDIVIGAGNLLKVIWAHARSRLASVYNRSLLMWKVCDFPATEVTDFYHLKASVINRSQAKNRSQTTIGRLALLPINPPPIYIPVRRYNNVDHKHKGKGFQVFHTVNNYVNDIYKNPDQPIL